MTRVSVEPGTLIADVSQDPGRPPGRAWSCARGSGRGENGHSASEEAVPPATAFQLVRRLVRRRGCSSSGAPPRTAPADTGRSEV